MCTPVRGTVSEPFSSGVCEDRREFSGGRGSFGCVFRKSRQDERTWGLRKGRERRQDERTGDDVTRSTDRRMGRNGEGIHRESNKHTTTITKYNVSKRPECSRRTTQKKNVPLNRSDQDDVGSERIQVFPSVSALLAGHRPPVGRLFVCFFCACVCEREFDDVVCVW